MRIRKLMLLLLTQSVLAEDMPVVVDDSPPSLEFLDYLGAMVETGDELVGPGSFEESTEDTRRDEWISRDDNNRKEAIYHD